MKIGLEAAIL